MIVVLARKLLIPLWRMDCSADSGRRSLFAWRLTTGYFVGGLRETSNCYCHPGRAGGTLSSLLARGWQVRDELFKKRVLRRKDVVLSRDADMASALRDQPIGERRGL